MWAGAFFTVAKYGLGVNSEELYRYKGAYGAVKPLPSKAVTESCTEMMQSRCPFEAADIGDYYAPLWEQEDVCSSCIVDNWEALARECTYDVDDDYYNDVPLRYNGTGVLDGLIVHCRTLCPKGVEIAHCTQAPSMFVQKDGFVFCLGIALLWLSGTFFTAGCVYIDSPSGWFGFEACGEGRMGGNDGGVPNASSPLWLHLSGLLRAQASMWGQVCMWQSFWNFLEFYQPATFWREFSYVILGLLGFLSTRTFYPQSLYEPVNERGYEFSEHSEMAEGAEGQDSFGDTRSRAYTAGTSQAEQVESDNNAPHKRAGKGGSSLGAQLLPTHPAQLRDISQAPSVDKPTIGTALRALVSLLAQLTHLVGCWTILITYTDFIGPWNDYTKQATFAALGFALVAGSGTLTAMAGIEDPDPDDPNYDQALCAPPMVPTVTPSSMYARLPPRAAMASVSESNREHARSVSSAFQNNRNFYQASMSRAAIHKTFAGGANSTMARSRTATRAATRDANSHQSGSSAGSGFDSGRTVCVASRPLCVPALLPAEGPASTNPTLLHVSSGSGAQAL